MPLVRMSLRGPDLQEPKQEFRQDSVLIGSLPCCDWKLPEGKASFPLAIASVAQGGVRIRLLESTEPARLLKVRDECQIGSFTLRLDFLAETSLSHARQQQAVIPVEVTELQAQLERDRQEWEADAERQAELLAVKTREMQDKEKQLQAERSELEQLRTTLTQAVASPAVPVEVQQVREELLRLRDSLYQQYRQRRDAVVAMREAVRHAASKVQEEKRQFRVELLQHHEQQTELHASRYALTEERNDLAKQAKLLEEWQQQLLADQKAIATEQAGLLEQQKLHQAQVGELHADLVRLQRHKDELSQKASSLEQRATELQSQENYWSVELPKLHAWQAELQQSQRRVSELTEAQTKQAAVIAEQTCLVEQQSQQLQRERQALQDRLQGCADWERQLGQDRLRLDRLEAEWTQRQEALQREMAEHHQQEEAWKSRMEATEVEYAQLRHEVTIAQGVLMERQAVEDELASRRAQLDEAQAENQQLAALLQQRLSRVNKLRHRLRQRRLALGEQLQVVTHSESAHESLQEQLRRRMATLSQRETDQQALEATYQARLTQVKADEARLQEDKLQWLNASQEERQSLDQRRVVLDEQAIQLQKDRETLAEHQQTLLSQRQQLDEERRALRAQQESLDHDVAELETSRSRLDESLPGLLRSAEAALERIVTSRTQLRTQLHEIHAYRQRCHDEITARRQEVQTLAQQLEERHQVLSRLQDEQRLEAAALKQDCLHWQSQVQLLEREWQASREDIDEKEARLASQSMQIEQSHTRLQLRSEELQDKERDVDHRRSEVNKHLHDMQGWYRGKLRDMAEKKLPHAVGESDVELYDPPRILPLKSTRTTTDQHLADLLSGMGLIDAATLQSLMEEAAKQRSSLRDCLLQNEFLTSFQMELIEAGRLEALVLGPLRVIDRLRSSAMETIYRVFDPRLGDEALLRQLSASVDANWQEEYQSLFQRAAQVNHVHVAGTLEVLSMAGSPAVLQEWVVGLPGTEWHQLITEPSLALKLIVQIASGLAALHDVSLVHGQLHVGRLLLTPAGDLKLCGAGEPRWLTGLSSTTEPTMADDLDAVIEFILPWCRGRSKQPGSSAMADFIKKLESKQIKTAEQLHTSAYAVLRSMHANETEWKQLLHFVQDRLSGGEQPLLKKTA